MELPCLICRSTDNDEVDLGKFSTYGQYKIHRNCLVLCRGKFFETKKSVIFTRQHLQEEESRYELIPCSYCPRLGANLACSHEGCQRSFHTKCGVDNMALLQYDGRFNTFCAEHVPEHATRPEPGETCVLCLAPVVAAGKDFSPALAFQAPCCQNGWFHRVCVQDQSDISMDAFKCPLCRDEKRYEEVALFGVAVPKWRFDLPETRKRSYNEDTTTSDDNTSQYIVARTHSIP
ncbi:hypothetical protein KR038_004721 [Drosophila bunnanda]|nr:hypothetical protein KR038_004721 [Drosophila bunnanda]